MAPTQAEDIAKKVRATITVGRGAAAFKNLAKNKPPPSPPPLPPLETRRKKHVDSCTISLTAELLQSDSLLRLTLLSVRTAAPIPSNAECRISLETSGAAFQSHLVSPIPQGYSQDEDGRGLLMFSSGIASDPTQDYAMLHAHHPDQYGPDRGFVFDEEGELIKREASIIVPLPPPIFHSDFVSSLSASDKVKVKRTRRTVKVFIHLTSPAIDSGVEAPLFERTLRLTSILGLDKSKKVDFPLYPHAFGHRLLRWKLEELYRNHSIFARRATARHVPAGRPLSLLQQDFVRLLSEASVIHDIIPRSARQGSGASSSRYWPPFSSILIGPTPHATLSDKDAASIFRAILREPRSEQTLERSLSCDINMRARTHGLHARTHGNTHSRTHTHIEESRRESF